MELLRVFICITSLLVTAYGDGEVLFMASPPSIEFQSHEPVDLSILKEVFSVALGFTTSQDSDWRGVIVKNPFHYADAVVGLAIPGVATFDLSATHRYPLETDSMLDETWASVEASILERYPYGDNQTLVYTNLEDGQQEAEINLGKGKLEIKPFAGLKHLKESVKEHKDFLDQVALLNAFSDKINEDGVILDGIQDAYWFVLPAYHALVDVEGADSKVVFEAKRLLSSAVLRLTQAFESAYNGRVLVAVLASDVLHTRRYRRQATTDSDNDTSYSWNLAPVYSPDYAATFNILLWFSIAFVMAIIAISMATAGMDPGDSIIYRMTSNRMKKEN